MFATHLRGGNPSFDLVTTSKDTHLELGRVSLDCQYLLAFCLEGLFRLSGASSVLVQLFPDRGAVLVTKTVTPAIITFILAPAH